MPQVKSVHVGGIDLDQERVCTVVKGSRHDLMYELNNWLFDYCYAHEYTIQQLPHLDDWTRSPEDHTFWSLTLPEHQMTLWMRAEPLEL